MSDFWSRCMLWGGTRRKTCKQLQTWLHCRCCRKHRALAHMLYLHCMHILHSHWCTLMSMQNVPQHLACSCQCKNAVQCCSYITMLQEKNNQLKMKQVKSKTQLIHHPPLPAFLCLSQFTEHCCLKESNQYAADAWWDRAKFCSRAVCASSGFTICRETFQENWKAS